MRRRVLRCAVPKRWGVSGAGRLELWHDLWRRREAGANAGGRRPPRPRDTLGRTAQRAEPAKSRSLSAANQPDMNAARLAGEKDVAHPPWQSFTAAIGLPPGRRGCENRAVFESGSKRGLNAHSSSALHATRPISPQKHFRSASGPADDLRAGASPRLARGSTCSRSRGTPSHRPRPAASGQGLEPSAARP